MQAYIYAAKIAAAGLAESLGHRHIARELKHEAVDLQKQFEAGFWDDEMETYVLALDGEKQPCRVPSSNAGHVLFSGIAAPDRAARVVQTLMAPASFSGWGIRTIAVGAERYNPMSYHNGSVWPHDNAMIAAGFARYGFQEEAAEILTAMFNASIFVDLHRLPELFCGFPKRPSEGPTLYPVACSPQAWAAGSVFMLLQASLGMSIDARTEEVRFTHSVMPEYLSTITISNLRVGDSTIDVRLQRGPNDVSVNVLRNDDNATVVVTK
jgi:glycogen debranching enzyme